MPSVVESTEELVLPFICAFFDVEESNGMGIVLSAASKWIFAWPSHEAMLSRDKESNEMIGVKEMKKREVQRC